MAIGLRLIAPWGHDHATHTVAPFMGAGLIVDTLMEKLSRGRDG